MSLVKHVTFEAIAQVWNSDTKQREEDVVPYSVLLVSRSGKKADWPQQATDAVASFNQADAPLSRSVPTKAAIAEAISAQFGANYADADILSLKTSWGVAVSVPHSVKVFGALQAVESSASRAHLPIGTARSPETHSRGSGWPL